MSSENSEVLEVPSPTRQPFLQLFLGLSEEQSASLINLLGAPTPPEWRRKRVIRGGTQVDFVSGQHFIEKLNEAFGILWSFEVVGHIKEGDQIAVHGRWSLQIPGRTVTHKHVDGSEDIIHLEGVRIVKEQYGSSEVKRYSKDIPEKSKDGQPIMGADNKPKLRYHKGDVIDLGDDLKGAATDAMKKSCTQLGLFLDVYGPPPPEGAAKSNETQLRAFYIRADKVGMDRAAADAWAVEQLGTKPDQALQLDLLGLTAKLIQRPQEEKKKKS